MPPLRCANAPSAARAFLQLANRYSTAAAQSSIPFEFLVPRCANSTLRPTEAFVSRSKRRTRTRQISQFWAISNRISLRRPFATTSIRQQTKCVLNPQTDEEGNEMMLEITPRAAKRLSQIMAKDENPNLALRIQVESGGCHGFQYLMSLITLPPKGGDEWSSVVNEDDTIFQFQADEAEPDPASEQAPKIILDEPSLDLLKGSKVDFTMELIGSQFKIVDNPYATSSCGCGTSFDIKM